MNCIITESMLIEPEEHFLESERHHKNCKLMVFLEPLPTWLATRQNRWVSMPEIFTENNCQELHCGEANLQ